MKLLANNISLFIVVNAPISYCGQGLIFALQSGQKRNSHILVNL